MKIYITIFFTGLFISFMGALPLGTLNVLAAQISIEEGVSPAIWFSLGALLVEMVYVRLSLVAMDWFRQRQKWVKVLERLTVIILLLLAFGSFRAAVHPGQGKGVLIGAISATPIARLLTGMLLSAINPLQVPFWFGWSSLLFSRNVLLPRNDHYNVYITGIGLGTFIGNGIFIFGGRLFVTNLSNHQSLVNGIIGVIFLVTALIKLLPPIYRGRRD